MIIGVGGPNGAGKGEVIRYLVERSFCALSLSDVIRELLREQGIDESREEMIRAGRALRAERGPGILAEMMVKQLTPDRNYAIDSLRHPAEVEVLRGSALPFSLVWIDAEIQTRFARIERRRRPGDPRTLEELRELEARELGGDDPAAQQLLAVREAADHVVRNDGSLEELHAAIREVFEHSQFFDRPSWDEYFMSIARVVASRSNCVKRKVAAVVTRDRRIISTGYNGTPRGTRNCNEGGCARCNDLAPEGTRLDECLCSHGEENAITQAAFHGVSLRGGTIYTTLSPCLSCTKLIINAGLCEVVYSSDYPLGERALDLLREAGVAVRQL